jgi:hypothetical protein
VIGIEFCLRPAADERRSSKKVTVRLSQFYGVVDAFVPHAAALCLFERAEAQRIPVIQ